MNGITNTPEIVAEAIPFASVLGDAKLDKRAIASAIADAFISGMITRERLIAQSPPAERPGA